PARGRQLGLRPHRLCARGDARSCAAAARARRADRPHGGGLFRRPVARPPPRLSLARDRRGHRMTLTAFDVAAVRARFSALDRPLAFFDAPSGTQVPDEVVDAIAGYLRRANANLGTPDYDTARATLELVEHAHDVAGRFLGCSPDETVFGQNMTTLNFSLTRAAGRELRGGDEIVVTRLDHDASVAPWLELARDRDLVVHFADVDDECRLDLDDLERRLSDRTRVVAFPLASNAIGTIVDVARVVELAHAAGALAWADAVHFGPHGRIDVAALGVDVLLCSPYKFVGAGLTRGG